MDLLESIAKHGIRDPLIVYQDRVLWGMRRWEIAGRLEIATVRVLEISDDPGCWSIEDVRAFRRRMNL